MHVAVVICQNVVGTNVLDIESTSVVFYAEGTMIVDPENE